MDACQKCGREHPKCAGHSKNPLRPCGSWPVVGSDKCRMHIGVGREGIRRAGQRAAALEQVGRLARRAGSNLHPIEHLLDSLYRAAAEVEVFGQLLVDLDNQGELELENRPGRLRGYAEWTTEIDPVTDKPRRVLELDPLLVRTGDNSIQVHPFLKEYNDALERRARMAKMAMDAGVAERQVQLAEQQAVMLAGAVRSILTELGVPLDRRAVGVVQRNLRALAAANPAS
jgi:hypothetical protein